MIYQPAPEAKSITYVYAGHHKWINAKGFGGIRHKNRVIHLKLTNKKEGVTRGNVSYVVPQTHKRRVIRWNGKKAMPLRRMLKPVKGSKKHKVVLKLAHFFVHKPGYLLPPRSIKRV